MVFNERLNLIRKSKGYTAQFMADSLGIGLRHYRKYESGDTKPTIDGLINIADILDISIDYLLCRDEWLIAHGVSADSFL